MNIILKKEKKKNRQEILQIKYQHNYEPGKENGKGARSSLVSIKCNVSTKSKLN